MPTTHDLTTHQAQTGFPCNKPIMHLMDSCKSIAWIVWCIKQACDVEPARLRVWTPLQFFRSGSVVSPNLQVTRVLSTALLAPTKTRVPSHSGMATLLAMQREFTILKALETRRDYYDGDGNRHVAATTTSSNCEARHPSEPSRRGGLEHRVPLC